MTQYKRQRLKIHSDLSGKCRVPAKAAGLDHDIVIDVPRRLYINFKHFGSLSIGARTQAWLPFLGSMPYTKWYWWWFISYHPKNRKPGYLVRHYPELYPGFKKVPHDR